MPPRLPKTGGSSAVLRGLAELLVPALCVVCRQATARGRPLCGACIRELNASPVLRDTPPDGVSSIVSCASHEGVARSLLAAYKFRGMIGLGDLISGMMADLAGPSRDGLAVVPVPPSPMRRQIRGFDPVEPLAKRIAGSLSGAGLSAGALVRRGSGRQRGRGRAGRLGDPPDIRIGPRPLPAGRPVLLVDDVITTGATLAAAAAALQATGSGPIRAITFTRRL